MYEKYDRSKYRYKDTIKVRNEKVWWAEEYIYKNEYYLTNRYKKWLEKKKEYEKQHEIYLLKAKLQKEYETYGEVDAIEFNRFQHLIKNI